MAFLEIKNVKIVGIATGVPRNIIYTKDCFDCSSNYCVEDFIKSTGIISRRVNDQLTTSDLCYAAAEKLIEDIQWDKSEIEALIFVTQGPDYVMPSTACIMQDKLNLKKECYAAEIALGCSGWVYGLSYITSILSSGSIKKALLLVGEAKFPVDFEDPLQGYAGTATAIEYEKGATGFKFHCGTDGSGYDAIIVPDGGSRNGISEKSFIKEPVDGKMKNRLQSHMKGMDVFAFAISTIPKSLKKLIEHFDLNISEVDYWVFHQANLQIDEIIRGKLKIPGEKVPYSLHEFGNTSSASIPLTINTQLKGRIENGMTRFICSGFGIGLSWGSVYFETNNIILSDLVEI